MAKINKNYQTYTTKDGDEKHIHVRVAEKKYGNIPKDFVVHHIDGDKNNNQYNNLILLHKKDHRRVHIDKDLVLISSESRCKNCGARTYKGRKYCGACAKLRREKRKLKKKE